MRHKHEGDYWIGKLGSNSDSIHVHKTLMYWASSKLVCTWSPLLVLPNQPNLVLCVRTCVHLYTSTHGAYVHNAAIIRRRLYLEIRQLQSACATESPNEVPCGRFYRSRCSRVLHRAVSALIGAEPALFTAHPRLHIGTKRLCWCSP